MNLYPARADDVRLDRDRLVAAAFLASYREPTRSLYAMNLRQWFSWCAERGMSPLDAKRAHLEVWARELEELKGLKASTVANKLNASCRSTASGSASCAGSTSKTSATRPATAPSRSSARRGTVAG